MILVAVVVVVGGRAATALVEEEGRGAARLLHGGRAHQEVARNLVERTILRLRHEEEDEDNARHKNHQEEEERVRLHGALMDKKQKIGMNSYWIKTYFIQKKIKRDIMTNDTSHDFRYTCRVIQNDEGPVFML